MEKVDELVKQYEDLRDLKNEINKLCKEKVARVQQKLNGLEMQLLAFLNETGQKNATTKFGTAYKEEKKRIKLNDEKEFFTFVKENDAFDLLTKSISSTVYTQYKEDGITVPGVSVDTEWVVRVRKSTNKSRS